MSYMCPICNGLYQVEVRCPTCHNIATDNGRYSDFFDPYSPYRPIDDLKMTDGFADHDHHCIHMYHCSACGHTFTRACPELISAP